jgi:phosphoglycolate phosphatase-like HAD superfamily hydrolase
MDVLLRTASTYARACLEIAGQIELKPTQRISIHLNQPAEQLLADIVAATTTALNDVLELHAIRAEIRTLIGRGNNEVIDRLLAERDAINSQEKILNDLIEKVADKESKVGRLRGWADSSGSSSRVDHDAAQVTAALDSVRQRLSTVTSGEVADSIEVPSLPREWVKALRNRVAALRRRRTMVNDQLAAENLRQTITLSPELVEALRKHQIIE